MNTWYPDFKSCSPLQNGKITHFNILGFKLKLTKKVNCTIDFASRYTSWYVPSAGWCTGEGEAFHQPGVVTKAPDITEETTKAVDSMGDAVGDSEDFVDFAVDGFRNIRGWRNVAKCRSFPKLPYSKLPVVVAHIRDERRALRQTSNHSIPIVSVKISFTVSGFIEN